jgi:hypothetical protein
VSGTTELTDVWKATCLRCAKRSRKDHETRPANNRRLLPGHPKTILVFTSAVATMRSGSNNRGEPIIRASVYAC